MAAGVGGPAQPVEEDALRWALGKVQRARAEEDLCVRHADLGQCKVQRPVPVDALMQNVYATHLDAAFIKNPAAAELGGDTLALAAFVTRPQAELQIGA